jgi:hypothetical protein
MSTEILGQKIGKTGYGLLGKYILPVNDHVLTNLDIRSDMEIHNPI